MSSVKTSTSFLSDFSQPSRRDCLQREKKGLAASVRLETLHHKHRSAHVREVNHQEVLFRTHRLRSLKEELDQLAAEKLKRREMKARKDLEAKRLERERVEMELREKVAQQNEKIIRKVLDLKSIVTEESEVESQAPQEVEAEYSSSSSSQETPRHASPEPQSVLVNRGGVMVQIHLLGKKVQRKKPIVKYTEEEAKSPDSPGMEWLRLWGMLKRKRKPLPSPPPPRHKINTRMLEYSQRVKRDFSPTVSTEKQLEMQLRGSDLLPKQFERVSLGMLSRTTHV